MKKNKFTRILFLGLILSFNMQAVMITGGFTGAWYNVDASGQGFLIQAIENDDGPQVMVFWFTFDTEGNQNWLLGVAPIDGNQVTLDMAIFAGGIFNTEGFDNSNIISEPWGTLTLAFQNCNKGTATYAALDEEIGSGSYTIKRLTKTKGTNCSGGTSDDSTESPDEDVQIDFVNTGADNNASGRLKFERNDNFDQLKLWYKNLPAGAYDLLVDGEIAASLTAKANGQSHQFFSSPQHENWLLLDFEVLGKTVEIAQDGVVFLTANVPE